MRIDKIAYASLLRCVSPSVKVPAVCACILICLLSDSLVLCAFLFVCSVLTVHFLGGTKMRDILHLMSIPISFVVMGCIAILISFSGNNTGMLCSLDAGSFYIGIQKSAVRLCVYTASKSFACVSCMNFLSLTTPMNDLFGLLRRSVIPNGFVEMAELIYRYIFVLYDCAQRIELAQKTRLGYSDIRASYRSVSSLAVSVFVRAYKQADRTYTALEARGYTGSLATVNRKDKINPRHALLACAYLFCVCALAVFAV